MISFVTEWLRDYFVKSNPIDMVCTILIAAFGFFTLYKRLYLVIGFFARARRFPDTRQRFRYAFVIAARNEEKVIGNLIDSIRGQNYPQELLTVFVVADNCTDATAAIARQKGALVYERRDGEKRRKGYALEFLFAKIGEEYGFDRFDGFFVFDADNLLAPDFTYEMNKAFASGAEIVTSYRNSKNFDTNFVSSAYGIHFYHNTIACHRPRAWLGVGTHLTGTGYLFSSGLIREKGWHYTNLTEDDEFSLRAATEGHYVAFCETAEFYDEQPVDLKTSMRQRIRWARGRIVNFIRNGGGAFAAIFRKHRFTNYDLFFHYMPVGLCTWILGLLYPLCSFLFSVFHGQMPGLLPILTNILMALAGSYFYSLVSGAVTVIREYRHISCSLPRLMLYVLCYPWFSVVSVYIYVVALFWNIKWTPIVHNDDRTIGEIGRKKEPGKRTAKNDG